jgi:chromosome segregation ATPase
MMDEQELRHLRLLADHVALQQRVEELEREVQEFDEANRDLVKRGDYYMAKAEAAEAREQALQQRVEELEEEEKGWQDSWGRLCDEQEARERVLREALEWMDRKGGLGLDVHERIDAALSAHKPVIT